MKGVLQLLEQNVRLSYSLFPVGVLFPVVVFNVGGTLNDEEVDVGEENMKEFESFVKD